MASPLEGDAFLLPSIGCKVIFEYSIAGTLAMVVRRDFFRLFDL